MRERGTTAAVGREKKMGDTEPPEGGGVYPDTDDAGAVE